MAMRNYKAMGDDKLRGALTELFAHQGNAYERVVAQDGDLAAHQTAALAAAQERGWDTGKVRVSPPKAGNGPTLRPMLCHEPKTKDAPLPGKGWVVEPKLDGWRFMFWRASAGSPVKLRSYAGRNGAERTGQAVAIEAALEGLPPDTILDAELIVPYERSPRVAHELAHGGERLQAVVFDVLRLGGTDTTVLTFDDRRILLERLGEHVASDNVRLSECFGGDADAQELVHLRLLGEGYEGVVAKRRSSTYLAGRRSWDWLKYKPQQTAEATVIGFRAGKNGRQGTIGAFEIRMHETGIDTTCACTLAQSDEIVANPQAWLNRVIEVRHHGLMDSGKPRHPVFSRTREDLEPAA